MFQRFANEIRGLAEVCDKYGISYKNGGVIYTKKANEIEDIVKVCEHYGIKYKDGGTIFESTSERISEVCEVCKKLGIDYSKGGLLFTKSASEIEEIVEICREYNIPYEDAGGVFKSKPERLREIAKICNEAGVEVKGAIFFTNPDNLRESINYVRDSFGDSFVNRMIVYQSVDRLKEVLPYLESNGYLEGLLGKSTTILSLTLDEIKLREEVIRRSGEDVLVNGNFNSKFGQTRKVFLEKHSEIISKINNGISTGSNHK